VSDEHRIHDHAPMFDERTGKVGDLPDTLAEFVASIEKPGVEIADWNGGEIWDDETANYPYATFRWFDDLTEFADGDVWVEREFNVEAHWIRPDGVDYDCLVIDSIQDVIADKHIYTRPPGK
jgi:hypothetical protein